MTKKVLIELLSRQEEINDELLDQIIEEYITYCEENSLYKLEVLLYKISCVPSWTLWKIF